jgi:malate dehydrogenase
MFEIAIVGAGEVGALLARLLAGRDLVRRVSLVDDSGAAASGIALDIQQSGAIAQFHTQVAGVSDLTSIAAAAVVIVADRADGGEWNGDEGVRMLHRINRIAAGTPVVCAGAAHRELVERGVREVGLPRHRIIGTAPEALASSLRSLIALEADGSPRDVMLTLLGVPPSRVVVPWEEATIGGIALVKRVTPATLRRLTERAAALWPPGPLALAAAAAKGIDALFERSRDTVSAFVAPDDAGGRRMRAAAFPVRLCREGIAAIDNPPLNPHDRIALENAILL